MDFTKNKKLKHVHWANCFLWIIERCLLLHMNVLLEYHLSTQSVSKHPQSSYSVAEIPHNKLKNRFANIFPCKL